MDNKLPLWVHWYGGAYISDPEPEDEGNFMQDNCDLQDYRDEEYNDYINQEAKYLR